MNILLPPITALALITLLSACAGGEESMVSIPTISPNGGTHTTSAMVTLNTATQGADIRYTLDGSDPGMNDALYTAPFALTNTTTVKAKAFRNGDTASNTATATFTITTSASDKIAPVVTAPSNITREATGTTTIVNLGTATAIDETDGALTPTNNAPVAGFSVGINQVIWTARDINGFSIGTTTVTWSAEDQAGNISTAQQTVTINAVGCSTLQTEFVAQTYPVLQTNCQSCHSSSNRNFKVTGTASIDFPSYQAYVTLTDATSLPLVLSKAMGISHSGGERITLASPEHISMSNMADQLSVCINDTSNQQGLQLSTGYERLYKVTMSLAGRVPTLDEELLIATAANEAEMEQAFDGIMNTLMGQEAFITRVKELYNDMLLTQHLMTDPNLTTGNLMSQSSAQDINHRIFTDPNKGNTLRREAAIGFAYAAEELVADIVRRDQPFTQILTADYFMCNPYTITAFGAALLPGEGNSASFAWDGVSTDASLHDANNFKKCHKGNYTYAGVLTDFAFLTKYPTTDTNMNRARSRVVQKMFLDIDVMSLANRADLDLENVIGTVPTLDDPQCAICHETLDPIAGLYKNWNHRGRYQTNSSWPNPNEILNPGYSLTDEITETEKIRSVQWMADKIIADDRFSAATVKTIFSGFTGLETPTDATFIQSLKNTFKNSSFNLKALVKAVLTSDYYLATNLAANESPQMFAEIGMAHLLTPEQLHRKIQSVTGYAWTSPSDTNQNLLDVSSYRLLYGGINSDDLIDRAKEPNGLIASVQDRVAYQTACMSVPMDFNKAQTNRILFPNVEITTTSETANRQNLQYLHKRVLGEVLDVNDPKINLSYQLFIDAQTSTSGTGIPNDCANGIGNAVKNDSNRTVRPWIAVLAYMLSDYRFFFE